MELVCRPRARDVVGSSRRSAEILRPRRRARSISAGARRSSKVTSLRRSRRRGRRSPDVDEDLAVSSASPVLCSAARPHTCGACRRGSPQRRRGPGGDLASSVAGRSTRGAIDRERPLHKGLQTPCEPAGPTRGAGQVDDVDHAVLGLDVRRDAGALAFASYLRPSLVPFSVAASVNLTAVPDMTLPATTRVLEDGLELRLVLRLQEHAMVSLPTLAKARRSGRRSERTAGERIGEACGSPRRAAC